MPWARRAINASIWSAALALAVVGSSLFHLDQELGRRAARDTANWLVSDAIAGTFLIGRVDVLQPRRVIARDVRVLDAEGTRVLSVDYVEGTFDPWALLRGGVHIETARVLGASARLVTPEGTSVPTIGTAFFPAAPSADPDAAPGGPTVRIDRIRIDDLRAEGDVPGVRGLRVEDLDVTGALAVERGEVDLRLYTAKARVLAPYTPAATIEALTARITSDPHAILALSARLRNDAADRVRARLDVGVPRGAPDRSDVHLRLVAEASPVSRAAIAGAGVPGLEGLAIERVTGWAGLQGPASDLTFWANVTAEAGSVTATGRIRPAAVQVRARTRGLALDRVVAAAPPATVAGEATLDVDLRPDGDAAPRFRATIDAFRIGPWAVPGIAVSGAIEPTRVTLQRLESTHAGGDLSVRGAVWYTGAVDVRVRARIPQIARDPNVRRLAPGARASVDADVRLRVTADEAPNVELEGRAALGDVVLPGLRARSVDARGSMRGRPDAPRLDVALEVQGLTAGGVALGTGRIAVRGGPRTYEGTAALREGARRIEVDAVAARTGTKWSLDAPRLELGVGAQTWRGVVERLELDPARSIGASLVRLASGTQRLELRGTYGFRRSADLTLLLQDLDVTALAAFVPALREIEGRFDTTLRLSGDATHPDLDVQGAVREGAALGFRDLESVYSLKYRAGHADVDVQITLGAEGTVAVAGSAELDLDGSPDLETALRAGAYDLTFEGIDVALPLVSRVLDGRLPPLEGTAQARAHYRGDLDAPVIDATLRGARVTLPGQPPLEVEVVARLGDGRGALEVAIADPLGRPLVRAAAEAGVPFPALRDGTFDARAALEDAPWTLRVHVPERPLEDLPEPWGEITRDWPVVLTADLSAVGGDGRPIRADLRAEAEYTGLRDSTEACTRNVRPTARLLVTLADGHARARLRGHLQPTDPVTLATAEADLPLDDWLLRRSSPGDLPAVRVEARVPTVELGELPFVCEYATGRASATLDVTRLFDDQPAGRLVVNASDVRVAGGTPLDAQIVASASSRAIVTDTVFEFPTTGASGQLQATLQSTWNRQTHLPQVSEDARFLLLVEARRASLAPILAFVPGIARADVIADGQVQAQGTRTALTWSGALELFDGHMDIVGPGQRLEGVRGRVEFRENRADIERLEARDVDGTVEATGHLDFRGLVPDRGALDLRMDKLPVRREGSVLATLSGRAELGARVAPMRTDMRVRIRELEVALPDEAQGQLQDLALDPDIVVLGEARQAPADPSQSYAFHVGVDGTRPFWIRRNDFAAQVRTSLDVLYQDPTFRVAGYVELLRGYFEILGKRFALKRGRMDFDGGEELNPLLDITAVYALNTTGTKNVTVTVSGRLSEPRIDFTSTEATDRGEIIALLVSGRARDAAASGRAVGTETQQAASFVTGVLGGILTLGLRNEFGEFLPTISLDYTGDGARIRAGFQADSFIRENLGFLSGVIEGAYVEGFVQTGGGPGAAGGGSSGSSQTTTGGFLLELQFPYDFVGSITYTPPQNFGLDVTWEP
jgi:translocation and assembly module TamB